MTSKTHYAVISYCADLTDPNAKQVPAFELRIDPDKKVTAEKLDTCPEFTDPLTKQIADGIAYSTTGLLTAKLEEGAAPQIALSDLDKLLRGNFFVSTIGERVVCQ